MPQQEQRAHDGPSPVSLPPTRIDLESHRATIICNAGIEFRRGSAGGGNQLRQPYLKGLVPEGCHRDFPETEHIHFFGFYIGNFPDLSEAEVKEICSILNAVA